MILVYLAVAFTVGILAGHVFWSEGPLACSAPTWFFPALVTSSLAVLGLLRRRPRRRLAAALVLFVVLGAWRYTTNPFEHCWTARDLAHYQSDEGVWATVEGRVWGHPDVQDRGTHYQLEVVRVVVDGRSYAVRGAAMVEATRYPIYAYGDTLRIEGMLFDPPVSDNFNYRRFLAERGIHSLIRQPRIVHLASGGGQAFWRVLYTLRDRSSAIINRIMPEPAAALTNGMALGIEGGISQEVNGAFKVTGTSHLIVISGSNIAFLSGALIAALGRVLPKRRAALVAAPLVLLYVLLVGADPPALRAGIMGLLGLGAVFFGRRGTAYVSLCAAGLVMLALNPLTLWDIGFQLSFMTSLGLILFSQPLSRAALAVLRRRLPIALAKRLLNVLDSTLIVTIAAQATVLPLILAYFGRLSPVSLLTNCLVLPVQPAILAGSIAALLAGALWQPLGQVVATVPWLLLSYTVRIVTATAAVAFASVDVGRVGPFFVGGYYVLLVGAYCFSRIARVFRSRADVRRAARWSMLLLAPVCLSFFAWRAQPDGRLHVVFIPGDDGEAAMIVAPGGRNAWLWDGRGDGEALMQATLRAGWVKGKPDLVLAPCESNPWRSGPCLDPATLPPGGAVALTESVRLMRLGADEAPALLLSYAGFSTLLPATLPAPAQADLLLPGPVSVLKVGGPGARSWPTPGFLQALRPQLVIWPLETTYPPDVTHLLTTKVATARAEASATVEVISDGQQIWLARYSATGAR